MNWHVTVRVSRYKQDGSPPRFDSFGVEAGPDEYVIDVIERIWAEQDRSLVFRHACHHGACGSCGLRINGHERLPCSVLIRGITVDGGTLTLEPLRNLPVVSDLMVNMAPFYERMEAVHFTPARVAEPILDETSGRPAVQPSPCCATRTAWSAACASRPARSSEPIPSTSGRGPWRRSPA